MEIDDRLTKIALFDYYADFLTEKQKTILKMYYYEDCGLTEIGQFLEISRQAVLDAVKKAEVELEKIEEKVGMVETSKLIKVDLSELLKLPEVMASKKAKEIIRRINDRI